MILKLHSKQASLASKLNLVSYMCAQICLCAYFTTTAIVHTFKSL